MGRRRLAWRLMPLLALVAAVLSVVAGKQLEAFGIVWGVIEFAILIGAVFAAVHHADVIAHRTGEPYGTLVLTVAVTVIEVALILSVMLAGSGNPELVRDTVFAVLMIVCNGLVGLCLIFGGFRYGEQGFQLSGTNSYLVVLMPLATLALILPNYTVSAPGPFYTPLQLSVVSIVTLVLYAVFLYVQTIRHRDYFLSDAGDSDASDHAAPDASQFWESVMLLLVALAAVVLLAKSFAGSLEGAVAKLGAPKSVVGLLVAVLVLLPESLAALRAARLNDLQKSLNLALGSSLATIGLTIPAVTVLAIWLKQPLALGLHISETIMLVLTFAVSLVTFGGGRTNILPGFVHLVMFGIYVFLIFAP
jgi:Ca2+:H+ antiporter